MKVFRLRNPYLLFSPFLLLYAAIIWVRHSPFTLDGGRYYWYAQNLLRGEYAPPGPDLFLWNGPGYPLFLAPLLALDVPIRALTLINALFLYGSVVLVYLTLRRLVDARWALVTAVCWGLYFITYQILPSLMTETPVCFLGAALAYSLVRLYQDGQRRLLLLAGFLIGYIALTKVLFGYVLLLMLGGNGLLWLLYRRNRSYQLSRLVLLVAFATTSPYLLYTYRLTGKPLYWGNSGGMSLYWMTTPQADEYGEWFDEELNFAFQSPFPAADSLNNKLLKANHTADYREIYRYRGLARDDAFKRLAMRNIKAHPKKFLENCFNNLGRLFFNYPYSYRFQDPGLLKKMMVNAIFFTFFLISLIPTALYWRRLAYPVRFLLLFCLLYIGGSMLASAYQRLFYVIVPMLMVWITYVLYGTLRLSARFSEKPAPERRKEPAGV